MTTPSRSGPVLSTEPRQHRDRGFLAAKQARAAEPHVAPVNALAREIADSTGALVPLADPDGAGAEARLLLLLETPSRAGGYRTGLISVDNDDTAAANLWRALAATGIDRRRVLLWNAVPWYVGSADKIRSPNPAEVRAGRAWLVRLVERLPELTVLASLGRAAATAVEPLRGELEARELVLLEAPHPSQRVYNRPEAQAEERVHAMLRTAARLIR